ncbi:MAG: FAD:protein FMN transferase, partial [Perlucidibaca sp.]
DARRVAEVLALVGWTRVSRSRQADGSERVVLPDPGMALDFGGFGKEYAADRAAIVLRDLGVRHGLVELAGDISVLGPHPDGSPWQVGVRHPRAPGLAIASIALSAGGLATSGDYERCMVVDGRRYAHILDARTGWPVMDGLCSLSATAPSCLLAGAVSTLGMLRGSQAPAWLADCPHPWLAVGHDLRLSGSLLPELAEPG